MICMKVDLHTRRLLDNINDVMAKIVFDFSFFSPNIFATHMYQYVCKYECMYTCVNMCRYIRVYKYTRVCVCLRMRVRARVRARVRVRVRVRMCVCRGRWVGVWVSVDRRPKLWELTMASQASRKLCMHFASVSSVVVGACAPVFP